MINNIEINKLRNAEFYQLLSDILNLIKIANPITLKVEKPYAVLKSINDEIEMLFKNERGSSLTEEINKLDYRRDEAIIGITLLADSYTHHYDEVLNKHAETLLSHINSYGSSIARQSLQAETATLSNLIKDWTERKNLTDAIVALKLEAWKEELDAANKKFNEIYLQRAQETGNASESNIKTKRVEAVQAWFKLRDLLQSRHDTALDDGENVAHYIKISNSINAIVDKYVQLINTRTKKTIEVPTDTTVTEATIVQD